MALPKIKTESAEDFGPSLVEIPLRRQWVTPRAGRLTALICGCALAAIYALGLSYPNGFDAAEFAGFGRDRWLAQGTRFSVASLAPFRNFVELELDVSSRPRSNRRVQLSFTNRGGKEFTFLLTEPQTKIRLPVKGADEFAVSVTNPFTPNATDGRQLGAQVRSMRVSSFFGVPLLPIGMVATLTVLLAAVTFAGSLSFPLWSAALLGLAITPAMASLLLGDFAAQQMCRAAPAALGLGLLLLGALLHSKFPEKTFLQRPLSRLSELALLGSILTIGTALRFWNLDFGLPGNFFHPDELVKARVIERMVEGHTLDPNYFVHPTLLLYLTYAASSISQWFGYHGTWNWLYQTVFSGRVISAVAGTLSIGVVFALGKTLRDARTGLLAAAFFAVFPLHVQTSHYLKEDVLLLFWMLLSALFALKAGQEQRARYVYLSMLFAGIATSTKYTGLLTLAFPASISLLAVRSWFIPSRKMLLHTIASTPLFFIGFGVCSPYCFINAAKFLGGLAKEHRHMTEGHETVVDPWSHYWSYMFGHGLLPGMTPITAAAAIIACGWLLKSRKKDLWFLVAATLLFYLPAEYAKAKNIRYLVPCLPFAAIGLAIVLNAFQTRTRYALAALLLAMPLAMSAYRNASITYDTREQMGDWMLANLPAGSSVVVPFMAYSPAFTEDQFNVRYLRGGERLSELRIPDILETKADYMVTSSLFYGRYFSGLDPNLGGRTIFRELFAKMPILKVVTSPSGEFGYHNPDTVLISVRPEDIAQRKAACEHEPASDQCTQADKTSQLVLAPVKGIAQSIQLW